MHKRVLRDESSGNEDETTGGGKRSSRTFLPSTFLLPGRQTFKRPTDKKEMRPQSSPQFCTNVPEVWKTAAAPAVPTWDDSGAADSPPQRGERTRCEQVRSVSIGLASRSCILLAAAGSISPRLRPIRSN